MYLVQNKVKYAEDSWYIQELKHEQNVINPQQVKVGGYYLYKERFGMIAVVTIMENTSDGDWTGFRIKVKQVIHSSLPVKKGIVFEVGYNAKNSDYPTSWHFEPALSLI